MKTPLKYRKKLDDKTIKRLTSQNIHPIVAKSLIRRNIEEPNIALLRQQLISYKGMKNIREIAIQLANAITNKEKIVIVADYDCDGATACTVAVSGLKTLGANVDFVVPNRLKHGYGLTPSVVDIVHTKKAKWIVTVDNGIASHDGVSYANKLGMKVLVTDHHLQGDTLPNAEVIVNPNQKGDQFTSKNLAGCGVMFYVLAATRDALKARGNKKAKNTDMSQWLDVVALGTVADVVKLDDNNRWLVNQGLQRIRKGHMRPGMLALYHVADKDYTISNAQDFGFALGPRLNAAGRIEDMSTGIRCLLSEDYEEALELAKQLNELNEKRKNFEKGIKETALAEIEAEKQKDQFSRIVFGDNFHEGVIGIVAGRIKELYYCPTIVFALAGDGVNWKGSARSIPGCHLRDVIDSIYKKHPEWFLGFGGHSMAAGLTITPDGKKHFSEAFEEAVKKWFNYEKPMQCITVDEELDPKHINLDTAIALSQNIWGQGFEEPTWVGKFIVNDISIIGKEKNHLKLDLTPLHTKKQITALHFFQNEEEQKNIHKDDIIEIVYRLQYSRFRGKDCVDIIIIER